MSGVFPIAPTNPDTGFGALTTALRIWVGRIFLDYSTLSEATGIAKASSQA
jgi:hypothetical protein